MHSCVMFMQRNVHVVISFGNRTSSKQPLPEAPYEPDEGKPVVLFMLPTIVFVF